MCEYAQSEVTAAEKLARFDRSMGAAFAHREGLIATTPAATSWMSRIQESGRVANQGEAAQLMAIGELFSYRLSRSADTEDWAMDTMAAVAAEVAAGLKISQSWAAGKVHYARAMRERLPRTAALFCSGDIDISAFTTVVSRTDLIVEPQVLARVDALVAAQILRWPSLSTWRLSAQVDKIVTRIDIDAVRRRKKRRQDRDISIGDDCDGICEIRGQLASTDAHALDSRLTKLAATVCPHDPRTREQRRADAVGALAAGADRLSCRCARPDCTAADRKPASPAVIHLIAEHATLTGHNDAPAVQIGAEGLVTAELLRELAQTATLTPLTHPGCCDPEPRYTPSKILADFVRARDLTCRWPGCDVPATDCDLDHSIPYSQGGPTHAANLKCYCRQHHLVKTFWGWTDTQLADATLILTSPAGDIYVTTPGSALLFPSLCAPVGGMPTPDTTPPNDHCGDRAAMMPKRRRTRAQNRTARVAAERRQNHQARTQARQAVVTGWWTEDNPPPNPDDDPPPF